MRDLVKALQYIETLDNTEDEVHIVNMSMGQHDSPPGLSQAVNRLADNKILIASAGGYNFINTSLVLTSAIAVSQTV